MSKERELLEHAASMLPYISEKSKGFMPAVALLAEIRFHLANELKPSCNQNVETATRFEDVSTEATDKNVESVDLQSRCRGDKK